MKHNFSALSYLFNRLFFITTGKKEVEFLQYTLFIYIIQDYKMDLR